MLPRKMVRGWLSCFRRMGLNTPLSRIHSFKRNPSFRQAVEQCASHFTPFLDRPLLSVLFPRPAEAAPLDYSQYNDAALFTLEYAMAKLWSSWGIEPDAVTGPQRRRIRRRRHHPGSRARGCRSSRRRTRASGRATFRRCCRKMPDCLTNSRLPRPVFISRNRSVFFVSSFTGKLLGQEEIPDAAYWRRQLEHPAQLQQGINVLRTAECDVFLEVWPDAAFTAEARTLLAAESASDWLPSLQPDKGRLAHTLAKALARFNIRGSAIDWTSSTVPYMPHKVFFAYLSIRARTLLGKIPPSLAPNKPPRQIRYSVIAWFPLCPRCNLRPSLELARCAFCVITASRARR